ncbi:response regulator [Paenibacillus sp. 2KB_20]|uniref:response regulator n=1 Tax=Paenibacillus sp. 2KB_20 TaxID=3232977 RepID=UPI003F959B06
MFKILIADDEWMIREGLKQTINWEALNCVLVGEAADGEQAVQQIQAFQPDILISDIRMPGMDGLELAWSAQEFCPELKVIFLTGFDDFVYAQQAIKLKASDFVLKPTDPDTLVKAIDKVCKELVRTRQHASVMEQLQSWKRDRESLVVQKLIHDSMLGITDTSSLEMLKEWLEETAGLQKIRVAVVQMEEEGEERRHERWLHIKERLYAHIYGPLIMIDELQRACIIPDEEGAVGMLKETVTGFGKALVYVGVSLSYGGLEQLDRAYQEALEVVRHRAASKQSGVSVYGDIEHLDNAAVHFAEGFRQVEAYVQHNFNEDISLQQLAARFHLSEAHFSRLFRKRLGVSFIEYLTRLRMEQAKRLLGDENVRIYEVSLAVGYQDSRYFSQIFRKYTGETPTEYRKRMLESHGM